MSWYTKLRDGVENTFTAVASPISAPFRSTSAASSPTGKIIGKAAAVETIGAAIVAAPLVVGAASSALGAGAGAVGTTGAVSTLTQAKDLLTTGGGSPAPYVQPVGSNGTPTIIQTANPPASKDNTPLILAGVGLLALKMLA